MRFLRFFLLLIIVFLPLSSAQGSPDLDPGLPLEPTWTSDGVLTGSQHGTTVGINGDLNGDGYDDLYIGAPKVSSPDIDRSGVLYVYQGGNSGLGVGPHWTEYGPKKGSDFGGAAAWAGDVDGDGCDELIVGAQLYSETDGDIKLANEGAAFLYYGAAYGLDPDPGWSYFGYQQDAKFGYSVSSAGDVNNDGYDDVIVGARGYTYIYENEGAAYVFHGSPAGLHFTPDWLVYGDRPTASFGSAVAGIGDINGDGFDDVAVGALGWDGITISDTGAVKVFLGSATGLQTTAAWLFEGSLPGSRLGTSVAGVGDVNNDGYADMLVGAPAWGPAFSYEGAAYLFLGSPSGFSAVPDWSYTGRQQDAYFGYSLSAAGDLNQDGYDDVVIGAYQYTDTNSKEGRAFVFYGGPGGLLNFPTWWADGEKADATFGYAVGGSGNLNGDDYLDLVVGAPEYRLDELKYGRGFVFYGVPEAPAMPVVTVYLPLLMK